MFTHKECPYALRNISILVAEGQFDQYNLKSFKRYDAKIWNNLPTSYKTNIFSDEFKIMIKSWDGPKFNCSVCDLYTQSIHYIILYVFISVYVCAYTDTYIHAHIYLILRHVCVIFNVIFIFIIALYIRFYEDLYWHYYCYSIPDMYWVFINHECFLLKIKCVALFLPWSRTIAVLGNVAVHCTRL